MRKERFVVVSIYPTLSKETFWEFNNKGLGLAINEFNNETKEIDAQRVYLLSIGGDGKTCTIKYWEQGEEK